MAFKKKNVEKNFLKYKECDKGQVLVEGVYEKQGSDNFGNKTHEFRTDDNEIQVLNSSGHLNYLMNEYASFGDYCKVTYEGTITLDKGPMKGKDSHTFTLEIDDDKFDKSFARNETTKKKTPPVNSAATSEDDESSDSELEDMTL